MAGDPKITIDIVADGSAARKDLDKTSSSFESFGKGLDKASGWAAGGIAAIGGLGVVAVNAAKEMERASTTVQRTYGDGAATLQDFAKTAAETAGVSSSSYLEMAAKLGPALAQTGQDMGTMAISADELITTAGNMALAMGTDVPTAADALGAALRGETDALGELGVGIDTTKIQAELLAQGITGPDGLAPAVGSAEYQQQLLNDILAGSSAVFGNYRAETDTTAEHTETMTAKWDDATTKLGEALLPVLGWVSDALSDGADWIVANKDAIVQWVPYLVAGAAAVWILNWAMAANPVVLLTLAIIALVAVLYYFREEIGKVAGAVDSFMDAVDNVVPGLAPVRQVIKFFQSDVTTLYNALIDAAGAIQSLIDLWDKLTTTTVAGIPSIPSAPRSSVPGGGGSFAAPMAMAGRSLSAAAMSTGPVSIPTGPTIIVQGAVDPDATARQIENLLRRRGRRIGGASGGLSV